MKLPTDVLKVYKEVHGWVGIISGLALFIAFYAGAITMFEEPLTRWATPPGTLTPPPTLDRTPDLIAKAIAAHPEAADAYEINLVTDAAHPARMSWTVPGRSGGGGDDDDDDDGGAPARLNASLTADGALMVERRRPSGVAQFIDVLHQQVGLPLPRPIAMPIMGIVSLLYAVALFSGVVVLLPSLVSDLFAIRIGRNVKRMWLDIHNVLGLFSLPFHIVMALTAVVFAFHIQFDIAQSAAFGEGGRPPRSATAPPSARSVMLTPAEIVSALREQAPGFTPVRIRYGAQGRSRDALQVEGFDDRHGMRGPSFGVAGLDPVSARITGREFMPGLQNGWAKVMTSFFALHFGNFGGAPIRWSYFLLGVAGALLFYTGNLLWIESRRKRERREGLPRQTQATRILGALTVGVPLGCMAGISLTIAAAKLLGPAATYANHHHIYYFAFLCAVLWSLMRGAARAGAELSLATAAAMLMIPLASIVAGAGWYDSGALLMVDAIAIALAIALAIGGLTSRRRAINGPRDSIWSSRATARGSLPTVPEPPAPGQEIGATR